jgi:phospholipid/cholesterol/gamma-HCH transport system substrate-binding protein
MSQTFRLGLFIVAALAVLVVGVFLIGNNESLFQPTYKVKADFQNVAGLADGADVRVGGLHQGTVKHIQLPNRPDGMVTVTMDLNKGTREVLNKGSVASIKSDGLVGDKYVAISFGSEDAPHLKDGDTIASEPPMDISNLVKKADQLLDTAKTAVTDLDGTASNLKSVSAKIDEGKGTVGALINDKTIYNQAAATVTSMHEDMDALKSNFLLRGFFNKRGYVDSDQLKKHEIAKLPAGASEKTFTYDAKDVFEKPGAAKLKNKKTLNDAGQFLQANKFGEVVIVAAASMKGDSDKDRVTTQAQAMVIRNYLVQNFRLDDTRIKTMGLGKTDDAGENGKIEIVIYPAEASSAAVQTPAQK